MARKRKASRVLTNAQWADLIDALKLAADDLDAQISSFIPPSRTNWDEKDKNNFVDWDGRRKRYRKLRKLLLIWERGA